VIQYIAALHDIYQVLCMLTLLAFCQVGVLAFVAINWVKKELG